MAKAAKAKPDGVQWYDGQHWIKNGGYFSKVYWRHITVWEPPDFPEEFDPPTYADDWNYRMSAMDRLCIQVKPGASMKQIIRQQFTATIRQLSKAWRLIPQQQKDDTWNEAAYGHASERPGRGGNNNNGWTHFAETEFAATWYANAAARTDFIDFHGAIDDARITSVDFDDQTITYQVHYLEDWPPTGHDWFWAYQLYRSAPPTPSGIMDTELTEEKLMPEGAAGWRSITVPYARDIEPGDHLRLLVRLHRGVHGVTNCVCEYDVPD